MSIPVCEGCPAVFRKFIQVIFVQLLLVSIGMTNCKKIRLHPLVMNNREYVLNFY